MTAYVCVTYAQEDRDVNDSFCRALSRYGFRYQCIHENSDPAKRGGILTEAALLVALTSEAADRAETVGADIRRALERGMTVLCVSPEENPLDSRFCVGTESGAVRIPYPAGKTPDRHSVALFIHRLFVRHLSRLEECFVESRCAGDAYGVAVRLAYRAHRGDREACYSLGRAYETGEGLPSLENEAALWMGRAADGSVPDALIRMGILRLSGKGTVRSPEAAFDLFRRASALGDCRGDYRLGLCYLEGLGVVRDPEQGVLCLRAAANAGYGPALYRLGCLCRDGIGTERDVPEALALLHTAVRRMAADAGEVCPPVYGRLPRRYTCVTMRHFRRSTLRKLVGEAALAPSATVNGGKLLSESCCMGRNRYRVLSLPEDVFEDAAALPDPTARGDASLEKLPRKARGDGNERETDEPTLARAALALGQLLAAGDTSKGIVLSPYAALRWYRYALRLGSVEAACALGDAYRRGLGLPALPHRAAALYRLAAEGGSTEGQYAYAVCCEQGIGVPEDPFAAVTYYERSAEAGYAPAQNNLGGCYEAGRGVVKNQLLAVEWYSRAAKAGMADAQCRLGICYEAGRGVTPDADRAFRLYEAAAAQEHAYALYRLGLFFHRRAHKRDEPTHTVMATESLSRALPGLSSERDAPLPVLDGEGIAGEHADETSDMHGEAAVGEESLLGVSDRLQALSLYRRAAAGGSPEAAYALYVCYRRGLGVAPDTEAETACLRRAAEGGCLQALYELGLCHMEGRGMLRDPREAVVCFRRVAEIWHACTTDSLWVRDAEWNALPPSGMPAHRAAGSALYMLGYCALYGLGDPETQPAKLYEAPDAKRVEAALPYLREAAELEHVGAYTLLGDLYAYGLMSSAVSSAEDEALRYYLEAGRVGSERSDLLVATGDATDGTVDALMSLARLSLKAASLAEDEGDAELARVNAWHSFSDCATLGSADALVGMADCLYRGWGESRNPTYARRMLTRAAELDGGRVKAALWLGDLLRSSRDGEIDPAGADAVYLRGLEYPCVESECGPYTFGLRRADRKKEYAIARTELYYRIATLRAVYFADEPDRRESFPYLAEAVLRGHATALDDLARIYEYETTDPRAACSEEAADKRSFLSRLLGQERQFRRLKNKEGRDPTLVARAARMHHSWLSDYYVALCPEPQPFTHGMSPTAVLGDMPDYVTAAVTPVMRVNALCYLGECFFEGRGLPPDPQAAVVCYRAAVAVPFRPERGKPLPTSLVNANYSLGWCLLYGVGTPVDANAAVGFLNKVAKAHSGAAYTLGICHEEGRGVVIPDPREALKHYRRAQTLGHPKAAERVLYLERLLKDREE